MNVRDQLSGQGISAVGPVELLELQVIDPFTEHVIIFPLLPTLADLVR